jgi:hypothetical protein
LIQSVSLGWDHSCAIGVDGHPYCWGANGAGQLGDSTTQQHVVPTLIPLRSFTRIEAGTAFTCAIDTQGSVWCWGRNDKGELGTEVGALSSTPLVVNGIGCVPVPRNTSDNKCAGGSLRLSGSPPIASASTCLHGEALQTYDDAIFIIDTSDLSARGTLHIDLALDSPPGATGGAYDLYGQCQPVRVGSTPLAHAWNVAPGSTTTLTQAFLPGDQFQLLVGGDSNSNASASNKVSIKVTVE